MLLKPLWKSRTIWAGIAMTILAGLSFLHVVPVEVEDAVNLVQFFLGILTIYFRFTTKVGLASAFTDNRVSGARTP